MRLLLFSNSTQAGEEYLHYPMPYISSFLGKEKLHCVFIPYAGVSINWDEYTSKVRERFQSIGQSITSVHEDVDPAGVLQNADVIVVGGGNTWNLLKKIQEEGLLGIIKRKALDGDPYIGWSAGSNMACPTIKTTNDMPIVQPHDFHSFHLIPFQINPHYLDSNPDGHAGETREARILEFIETNREVNVLGLREGSWLQVEGSNLTLRGKKNARLFRYGREPQELQSEKRYDFLLHA